MAARDEPHHRLLRQRRTFHERKNVLNELDDHELIKKYRQDRAGIVFVTDLLRERLRRPTARNKALSPEMQVIVAKWPGSVHDARIHSQSGLSRIFELGIVPAGCHLLGDSGYSSKTWLLAPYLRPLPGPQSAYNRWVTGRISTIEQMWRYQINLWNKTHGWRFYWVGLGLARLG